MIMGSALSFIAELDRCLSPLVPSERTCHARVEIPYRGTDHATVFVHYYNLPEARHAERRGGGAESENNRMMFSVSGFGATEDAEVSKVKITHVVFSLAGSSSPTHSLRGKTASPEKIAQYLADYLNQIAEKIPPNYTHE